MPPSCALRSYLGSSHSYWLKATFPEEGPHARRHPGGELVRMAAALAGAGAGGVGPFYQYLPVLPDHFYQYFRTEKFPGTFTSGRKLGASAQNERDRYSGEVLLVRWQRPGQEGEQRVAGKRIRNGTVDDSFRDRRDRELEDSVREMGAYLSLRDQQPPRCPSLLYAYGCLRDDHYTWLLTEYDEDAQDLFDVIHAKHRRGESFDASAIVGIMQQILEAVKYLHDHNICHRDISVENVLCHTDRHEKLVCKLMNFGQACPKSRGDVEIKYYELCGKDVYRAPEVYQYVHKDNGYEAAPVDKFAVGVLLFVMLTSRYPWRQAIREDLAWASGAYEDGLKGRSAKGGNMCLQLIKKDPSQRPTVVRCLNDLADWE